MVVEGHGTGLTMMIIMGPGIMSPGITGVFGGRTFTCMGTNMIMILADAGGPAAVPDMPSMVAEGSLAAVAFTEDMAGMGAAMDDDGATRAKAYDCE
jgi:hypothetical protein